MTIDAARFDAAPQFPDYLATVAKYPDLWHAVYRTASVAADQVDRLRRLPGTWRLLALSEDWCSDCVSTLPVIARLVEQSGIDLRVLGRDANPTLIDAHLTSGTRSIPVVMVLDENLRELGWWGPRPALLQRWYRTEAAWLTKDDRSRRKRAWYARDRGRSAVVEVVESIERAARRLVDR